MAVLHSAGSATLTTVPSMNAMLEARMVAARTYGPFTLRAGRDGEIIHFAVIPASLISLPHFSASDLM
jgi:hypothetical protein